MSQTQPIPSAISFQGGYKSILKTAYKKGRLPQVQWGFYGGKLSRDTVSVEHLLPHSQGGDTNLANIVLTTVQNNNNRGNAPIQLFFNKESAIIYFRQFINVRFPKFNGKRYITEALATLDKLGIKLRLSEIFKS